MGDVAPVEIIVETLMFNRHVSLSGNNDRRATCAIGKETRIQGYSLTHFATVARLPYQSEKRTRAATATRDLLFAIKQITTELKIF